MLVFKYRDNKSIFRIYSRSYMLMSVTSWLENVSEIILKYIQTCLCANIHGYDFLILICILLVAGFAFVNFVLTQKDDNKEKGFLDLSSESEEDKGQDIYAYYKKIDLRGTIRRRFGILASMQNSDESSVCSPVAALLPLGKLALGAKGSALQELYDAIGMLVKFVENDYSDTYQSEYVAVKNHLSNIIADLRNVTRPFLDVVSKIYLSKFKTLDGRFEHQATSIFKSAIEKVDFNETDTLTAIINGWVSSQTHEMIINMVSPQDVSPMSSLVIVNAIYYTGTWIDSFTEPRPGKFYAMQGERELPLMESDTWHSYTFSNKLNAELVEIPYAQQNMSMLLVVPKETNGLFDLLKRLKGNPEYLAEATEEMKRERVQLTMPAFRIESHWDLGTLYQGVGLKSIFKKYKSGLKGIVQKEDLYVSTAIQKAIIDVHDKGKITHILSLVSPWPRPFVVFANHPFLFYVRLKSQQLLMGTCC